MSIGVAEANAKRWVSKQVKLVNAILKEARKKYS